ncbi:MAG TPA: putative sulfate/molybdate transporter [Methylomirabilota bacterium]|jgi:MFS superfamily sulfate permease-like transporter|nr:putative sulfate/molybdate transporter [Methylomirabilota bacterium]
MKFGGNRYTLAEIAGGFGDVDTLVPFVVGYITINRLDPQSVLLGFGLVAVATGLYFRTPMPVQPMKALATMAITHPATVTPGMIVASAFATGVFWLAMAATGTVSWLAAVTSRPVVRGMVLGLGLSFMLEGVTMMSQGAILALVGAAVTFLLLGRRLPAIFALLIYGAGAALVLDPSLMYDLSTLAPSVRWPRIGLPAFTWTELLRGSLVLALPQVALTFGNAVIATAEENNRLFPDRPITVRQLALDHGLMNLAAAGVGGVPMCRGAGGMAGHIRFRARTGGAVVVLGLLLLIGALVLADSLGTLFRLFPFPVLGVILFFGGMELAASVASDGFSMGEQTILAVTAGIALWNMAAAYVAGLLLYHAWRHGAVRL